MFWRLVNTEYISKEVFFNAIGAVSDFSENVVVSMVYVHVLFLYYTFLRKTTVFYLLVAEIQFYPFTELLFL